MAETETERETEKAPSLALWAAKVSNVARSGRITQAVALLDSLKKPLRLDAQMQDAHCVSMHNAVLQAMVTSKQFTDARNFWLRMHSEGLACNVESFEIMVHACSLQGETERAFFLLDEMEQAYGLTPSTQCYTSLLRACGRAPYWVSGYERMVEDVLCKIEGREREPEREIYDAVIESYALAGDSVGAEYYFWEMQRKGLSPQVSTYAHLLEAYAKSQSVGASTYGWKGRFHRPGEEKLSEEEMAMKEIGAHRATELCEYYCH
jgi:pentatricopeptide repeat protein